MTKCELYMMQFCMYLSVDIFMYITDVSLLIDQVH